MLTILAMWISPVSASAVTDWNDKGYALTNDGRNIDALDAFNKAIELDPNNSYAWNGKGTALNNLYRNQEAITALDKAIELDPDYAIAWKNKGIAHNWLAQYAEGLAALNKAIELDPNDSKAWTNKGWALYGLLRDDEALVPLNKAIELAPYSVDAWNFKAGSLNNLGRYDEALVAANKACELDPKYSDAWNNKGKSLEGLGRYDEALTAYNAALLINPDYSIVIANKNKVLSKISPGITTSSGTTTIGTISTTQAPNPSITTSNPTPQSSSQNPTLFNPLIIIGVILLFCISGAGYYILHSRKTKPQHHPATEMPSSPLEQSAALPYLILTMEITQAVIDTWYRIPVHITNTGNADAVEISFTFSDEFETKWIQPATLIESGASTDSMIGLRPKHNGNIPLEIGVQYKDVQNKEYKQTFEYWIDVLSSPPNVTTQSPTVNPQKPITPNQLPHVFSDRYTESEFIGKGGFARVFKARRKDGQFVAVKIPTSLDAATGKSFIAEMQNWTNLKHQNIVAVYEYNIMPMPYFEEELCDNALSDLKKPLGCEESAWLLFSICEGLKFAHDRKIIHRDLKPQNILLKNGVPKISDWGLSRIISESTSTTTTSFTPYYAAPEQISSNQKDERTDIWQLGVIFYELMTGTLPFTSDSIVTVMAAIISDEPTPPSGINPSSKPIESIIMKCLEKRPDKRYPSVRELQRDLALYLRITYTESLEMSVNANDLSGSALYCSNLVKMSISTGDMDSAYKYLLDLVYYSKGDLKVEVQELAEQIKMRMDMGIPEIPDELIQKAEILMHQVSTGFRNKR